MGAYPNTPPLDCDLNTRNRYVRFLVYYTSLNGCRVAYVRRHSVHGWLRIASRKCKDHEWRFPRRQNRQQQSHDWEQGWASYLANPSGRSISQTPFSFSRHSMILFRHGPTNETPASAHTCLCPWLAHFLMSAAMLCQASKGLEAKSFGSSVSSSSGQSTSSADSISHS